jgi:hypothetical protein
MAIAFRGVLASNTSTTASTTVTPAITGWTGANPAAGDILLCICTARTTTASTWSQTGGPTWTFKYNNLQDGTAGGCQAMAAWRIMQAGDTAPTFTVSTSAPNAYAIIGFTPDAGNTMAIDTWAASNVLTTAASSITPNAATAAGTGEVSVVMVGEVNAGTGKNSSGLTMPSGYTTDGTHSDYVGASGQNQYAIGIGGVLGVSGTVTPGAANYGTSSLTGVALHVLLTESSGAAGGPPASVTAPRVPLTAPADCSSQGIFA